MKRKALKPNQSSSEHTTELPSRFRNASPAILYEDTTGKTVDFIRYVEQRKDGPAFEIRFTDGTILFIEPVPQLDFRGRLLKTNRGNIKTIREYRTIR